MKNNIPSIKILKLATESIKDMLAKQDKLTNTLADMFDGYPILTIYDKPIEALTSIVEEVYNDDPNVEYGSQYSWWLWEAKMGENTEIADSMKDENGKKIPMRTIEDLYNYYKKYNLNQKHWKNKPKKKKNYDLNKDLYEIFKNF